MDQRWTCSRVKHGMAGMYGVGKLPIVKPVHRFINVYAPHDDEPEEASARRKGWEAEQVVARYLATCGNHVIDVAEAKRYSPIKSRYPVDLIGIALKEKGLFAGVIEGSPTFWVQVKNYTPRTIYKDQGIDMKDYQAMVEWESMSQLPILMIWAWRDDETSDWHDAVFETSWAVRGYWFNQLNAARNWNAPDWNGARNVRQVYFRLDRLIAPHEALQIVPLAKVGHQVPMETL
jgi:hypothetical protein